MKLAAADAIAAAVAAERLRVDEMVPSVFAPGIAGRWLAAVAAAARADGVTR